MLIFNENVSFKVAHVLLQNRGNTWVLAPVLFQPAFFDLRRNRLAKREEGIPFCAIGGGDNRKVGFDNETGLALQSPVCFGITTDYDQ